MTKMRSLIERLDESAKGDASPSFVLLLAVQQALLATFTKEKGWKFDIEGVRTGGRPGQISDEYTLHGNGPNRAAIMVFSSNDKQEHMAIAQVLGTTRKKMIWEDVKKGDAKKIAAWVLQTAQADKQFAESVQEGASRDDWKWTEAQIARISQEMKAHAGGIAPVEIEQIDPAKGHDKFYVFWDKSDRGELASYRVWEKYGAKKNGRGYSSNLNVFYVVL